MAEPDWANLPSVVLYDLYQLLPLEERLSASSACKKWRAAFFKFPNWRHLHLITTGLSKEKNEFVAKTGRMFCKTLHITFTPLTLTEVIDIIQLWSSISRFHEFQLVGSRLPNTTLWTHFQSQLYSVLENCTKLNSLVLSHVGDLNRLAKLVAKHSLSLNSLGMGRIIGPCGDVETATIPVHLASFSAANLKILQLDGVWVSSKLVQWISLNLRKLKVLSLVMRETASNPTIDDDTWSIFKDNLPGCEVRVTYVQIISRDAHYNLAKASKLTHVRLVHCSLEFQDAFLAYLIQPGTGCLHNLRSLWSLVTETSETVSGYREAFLICAWRLSRLREIYTTGCTFEDYDLIGMMRLRPSLRIHIPKENIRLTLNKDILKCEQILPMNPKLTDKTIPIEQREALILHTITSYDCKKKHR